MLIPSYLASSVLLRQLAQTSAADPASVADVVYPVSVADAGLGGRGRVLRACVLPSEPYVRYDTCWNMSTKGFSGPAIDSLGKLAGLANFSSHLHYWKGTADSFVDHMTACAAADGTSEGCNCDIGVSAFAVTNDWEAKVDFLPPFLTERDCMVTLTSSSSDMGARWLSFKLVPFHCTAWVLIFAAIVFVTVTDLKWLPPDRARTRALRVKFVLIVMFLLFVGVSSFLELFFGNKSSFPFLKDFKSCIVDPQTVAYERGIAAQKFRSGASLCKR